MSETLAKADPMGSVWRRWEPHIHMPGTMKNDQFGKRPDADEEWIKRVLAWTPKIRVLGITDYYVLDCYRRAREWRDSGRLPGVELIFPNVELRFAVNVGKGAPVNAHLLVSPDDPKHLDELDDFLTRLEFHYQGKDYGCDRAGLTKLGRAFDPCARDDATALKIGVEQHKVSPDALIAAFKANAWAKRNILVGLVAGTAAGTGQLQESGMAAMRKKMEHLADIIFSPNPADRAFWLGEKTSDLDRFLRDYRCFKPCVHGCDAHGHDRIGEDGFDRFTWIKGDVSFESLRQACLEPKGRAFVGEHPPKGSLPSNTIQKVTITNADWLSEAEIVINPGLVAIIGARGSGKTALAEMIAAGAQSVGKRHAERSFLERAKDLVGQAAVQVDWGDGQPTTAPIQFANLPLVPSAPRARYLSQKFVDNLCSSEGLAEELLLEIERVIFLAHPRDERLDATSFAELREAWTAAPRRAKQRLEAMLLSIAKELSTERDLQTNLDETKRQRADLAKAIDRDLADRKTLAPSSDAGVAAYLENVRSAAEAKSRVVAKLQKQKLDLEGLSDEIEQFRADNASQGLAELKAHYPDAGLSEPDWLKFTLTYGGDVDGVLRDKLRDVAKKIDEHQGPATGEPDEVGADANTPAYFASSADLSKLTLSLLRKEQRRLEAKIGVDAERRRRYNDLSEKIVKAQTLLAKRDEEILHAGRAPERIEELHKRRDGVYAGIFSEIKREEGILRRLYAPLQERLNAQGGSLSKLTFSVSRQVDIKSWADAGERLFNLKKAGALRGVGTLQEIASAKLLPHWQNGQPDAVAKAMSVFRAQYGPEFMKHIPDDAAASRETRKNWIDQVTLWLYGTDHISMDYGLEYEGTDIQQLSPGTRDSAAPTLFVRGR